MKSSLVHNRSSYLVIWPVVAVMFLGCILSFIFKAWFLSLLLLILFLIMAAARLWSAQAVKKLEFRVQVPGTGFFPGDEILFQITVKNDKFLPVMCGQVYFPLSDDLCVMPEENRQVEEYEKAYLTDLGASLEKVGEKSLPAILWYETRSVTSVWRAERRGVYATAGWKLRAGDGFGLSQMELPAPETGNRKIAVFPKIIPVRTRLFYRMAWSADTGTRGIMEDHTVIRSTRDYLQGDPVKHINWRLAARGLPLAVNVYEEILPQSVFFLFDGESFSGREKHRDEMEDALCVVASVAAALDGKVRTGISFSQDGAGKKAHVPAGAGLEEFLWACAAYRPQKDLLNEDNKVVDRVPLFDLDSVEAESQGVGRYYYIVYDAAKLQHSQLLQLLGDRKVTVLSYQGSGRYADFETFDLNGLKVGGNDEK